MIIKIKKKGITVLENGNAYGYEPYFEAMKLIGYLNHEKKTYAHTHGYFPPHKHGIALRNYAKKLNYKYLFND
jgi:hypothetical protein